MEVGGRIHLVIKDLAGTVGEKSFVSAKITEIEEEVVLTRAGFYQVTVINPPVRRQQVTRDPSLPTRSVINFFSRVNFPIWMQLVVSRFPTVFLEPNPNIFDNPSPEIAAIEKRTRQFKVRSRNSRRLGRSCGRNRRYSYGLSQGSPRVRRSGNASIHSRIVKAKLGTLRWSGDQNLVEPFRTLFGGYVASVCARSPCLRNSQPVWKAARLDGWLEVLCDDDFAQRIKPRSSSLG